MKIFKVHISPTAHNCIKGIYTFCKNNYGIIYARKIRNFIRTSIYELQTFPEANPIHFIGNDIIFRKRIVNGRYVIVFQIIFNHIYILYVYDARRNINPKDIFKI